MHAHVTRDRRSGVVTNVRGSKPSLEKRTIKPKTCVPFSVRGRLSNFAVAKY
jgi:hypothetical protein